MKLFEREGLERAIVETQKQLALLVSTVGELTASVKVETARRQDLERRVDNLERDEDGRRQRTHTTSDQRSVGLQLLAISATVSLGASLVLLAITHIVWR